MNKIIIILTSTLFILIFVLPMLFIILHTCLPRMQNKSTPATFTTKYEDIEVTTEDNLKLKGWHIPNPAAKRTILICHGVLANRSVVLPVAKLFYGLGFEIYMFDFRNHGASAKSYISYGYNEVKDIRAIDKYIKSKSHRKYTVFGISMGAAITLLSAPSLSDVEAVIVDSPFASANKVLDYRLQMVLPKPIADFYASIIKFYTKNFFGIDINGISPIESVKRIHKPLLIIIGDQDKTIPPENGKEIYNIANYPKELVVIKNADHMQTFLDPEYGYKIQEFVSKY